MGGPDLGSFDAAAEREKRIQYLVNHGSSRTEAERILDKVGGMDPERVKSAFTFSPTTPDEAFVDQELRHHPVAKLIPVQVTVNSSIKFFGLKEGKSYGTELAMTFDVPEGMTGGEVRKAMLEEKEKLDQLGLTMEFLHGGVQADEVTAMKSEVKERYDRIFKRQSAPPPVRGAEGGTDTGHGT